jgi:hypothetical protein
MSKVCGKCNCCSEGLRLQLEVERYYYCGLGIGSPADVAAWEEARAASRAHTIACKKAAVTS